MESIHFYDPQHEFQEIGIQINKRNYWKLHGPKHCDALIDDEGNWVVLAYDGLNHLIGMASKRGFTPNEHHPTYYGPITPLPIPRDLLTYAQSLTWHGKALECHGLIWMGARYYQPYTGRFLSPDPIGYPHCLDLYAYANGDPVNYHDPDGRFVSKAYEHLPFHLSSISYHIEGNTLFDKAISFINGINTSYDQAISHAQMLQTHAGGAEIYGIHKDTTRSVSLDALGCFLVRKSPTTPSQLSLSTQLVMQQWVDISHAQGPHTQILQICHSGGAEHVKKALELSPVEVRKRITVLAIAPSVIIPQELCFDSFNYMSKRDFITYLDREGIKKYRDELIILQPHSDAQIYDHNFDSPTFTETIKHQIKAFRKQLENAPCIE